MTIQASLTVQRSINNQWITKSTGVQAQLDNVSLQVASQMQGASPFNTYTLYSLGGVPDILQGDRVMDEQRIDNKTGNNVFYTVMGTVEVFEFDHLEVLIEKIVGKVPL